MNNQDVLRALRNTRGYGYDSARAMPAAYYCSPEFLELEIEQLFRRQWICLGRQEEVALSGDYFVTELVGESVLVTRDAAGAVRAFSNVCRHRGTLLAAGSGNAERFVCPYHAWTYSNSGELLRTPHVERAECRGIGLTEFRCELWGGFIYVNLDEHAEPLAPQLTGLSDLTKNYHMQDMTLCFSAEQVWPTNWKCLAENFMEGYHLSHVHQKTLHPVTPTQLCDHFPPGPAYLGYYSNYPADYPTRGAGHAHLSAAERQRSLMFSVLPAHAAGVAAHAVFYVLVQPRGVGEVHAKLGAAVYDAAIDQQSIDQIGAFFNTVMDEDKAQLERLYQGMCSRFHQPGVLASADYEGTVLDFYHYMDRVLNQATQAPVPAALSSAANA